MDDSNFRGEKEENEITKIQSHGALHIGCDLSIGEWIFDASYPLYRSDCPFLSSEFNCRQNGRPDTDYEKWRWSPKQCFLPRFNALDFLGRIRKKRVMLVGDSIMRNQWESLVCLVEAVIPLDRKIISSNGSNIAFYAIDFEASIEFSWAPLLVELKENENNKRVLFLDSIEENAQYWTGVDFLLFDSAHWWTHTGKYSSWDLYEEGGRTFIELNLLLAYEKGLTTWARWIDSNLDPERTRVIFRSISPRHNRDNGWQCYKQNEPIFHSGHHTHHISAQLIVLKEVLKKMNYPVYLMEITSMSALRRDGHPSIYTKDEMAMERDEVSDCSHWCLPGVPDSWNQMLYALL
ncbi:hypothetical protein LUZ60_004143 [Juncus effusus]|nr:hypothetical protein LUZ60_004143 [Juncus effusus]